MSVTFRPFLGFLCYFMLFLWMTVRGKALELWQAREAANHVAFLPTFMVELDIVLHGGLLAGSITEVCCHILFFFDISYVVFLLSMCLLR